MHQTTAWDEAVDEGFLKGKIATLLEVGRERFGEPDEKTAAALAAISDLDRLRRMTVKVLRVRSWKGLLAIE